MLGIDLGTTNSCSAIMLNDELEVISFGVSQKKIIPSVVCYKNNKNILVGEYALNNLKQYINSTIFESKRLIGHLFTDSQIQDDIKNSNVEIIGDKKNKPQYVIKINDKEIDRIYPEEVSKEILKYFKENSEKFVESKLKEKVNITKAVITTPFHFSEEREKIIKIGNDVFKDGVEILKEPIAIGLGYGFIHPCKEEKTVLFFDIGGGSFGISIFKIKDKQYDILALGGGGHLGGENFNNKLIEYVKQKISEDNRFKDIINFENKKDNRILRILFEIKRKVIKVLSQLIEDIDAEFIYEGLIENENFILDITREYYINTLCKDLWKKIFDEIEQVFGNEEKIKREDINEIILVGGSSRTPGIQEKMKEYFKKEINEIFEVDAFSTTRIKEKKNKEDYKKGMVLQNVNVDEIVAQGAAIYTFIKNDITYNIKK